MDQHQYYSRVEYLLVSIEELLRQQEQGGSCTHYKDVMLDIERVRSELRGLTERQKVQDGMITGQFTRMHDRLDKLHSENSTLREQLTRKDHEHSSDINKINMHLKYTAGGFAAIVLLLNFFEKIRDFFGLLMDAKP